MSFNEPDEFFLKAMRPYEIANNRIVIQVNDPITGSIHNLSIGDVVIRTGKPYLGQKYEDGQRFHIPVMLANKFLVGYVIVHEVYMNDARLIAVFKELTDENIGDCGQPNKVFEKVKNQLQERTVTCEYEDKEEVQPVVSNPEQKS